MSVSGLLLQHTAAEASIVVHSCQAVCADLQEQEQLLLACRPKSWQPEVTYLEL